MHDTRGDYYIRLKIRIHVSLESFKLISFRGNLKLNLYLVIIQYLRMYVFWEIFTVTLILMIYIVKYYAFFF